MLLHVVLLIFVRLPFLQENNTALGIVAKTILETPLASLPQLIKDVPSQFPSCKHVLDDFKAALAFWDQSVQVVSTLAKHNKQFNAIHAQFLDADKFLQSRKKLF